MSIMLQLARSCITTLHLLVNKVFVSLSIAISQHISSPTSPSIHHVSSYTGTSLDGCWCSGNQCRR